MEKITPLEALKNLLTLKNLAIAIFFSAFGITVFLGVLFYKHLANDTKQDGAIQAIIANQNEIITYIKANIQPKQ